MNSHQQARFDHLKDHLSPRHNGDWLASPQDISRPMKLPRRLLLIGSCQADAFQFHAHNSDDVPVDFMFVNSIEVMPDKSASEIASYDLQVINFPLRFVMRHDDALLWDALNKSDEEITSLFSDVCTRLDNYWELFSKYLREHALTTLVTNFLVPQYNPNGALLPSFDLRNPAFFISELNRHLEKLVLARKGAYILNVDRLSAMFGKRFIQDDLVYNIHHNSLLPGLPPDETRIEYTPALNEHYSHAVPEFVNLVWNEIIASYNIINPSDQVKLIVVDLDDTLWKGVIGDLDDVGIDMVEGFPIGLLEALAYFKSRGGLLAILSKNNPEVVVSGWKKLYESRYSLQNFITVEASFGLKSEAMGRILEKANLTAKSVLFIDDNPVERGHMEARYPDMRVLHGFHYYWKRICSLSPALQVATLTEESLVRTKLIKEIIQRDEARASSGSAERFLAGLNIKVKLQRLGADQTDSPAFNRSFELLNKTNQFNSTGVRWTTPDFTLFVKDNAVYLFSAEDKFSSYGIVGLLLVAGNQIEQFVMSCRVAGLTVEAAVFDSLLKAHGWPRAGSVGLGAKPVSAKFLSTPSNGVCRDFYRDYGFDPSSAVSELRRQDPPHPVFATCEFTTA